MNDQEVLAYLGGFVDGEGCFSVNSQGSLMFYISQLDPQPLLLMHQRFGGNIRRERDPRGFRTMVYWGMSSRQAAEVIRTLRPYLIVKAEQADVALEYQKRKSGEIESLEREEEGKIRKELADKLRSLKRITYDHIELPENIKYGGDHTGKRIKRISKSKPPKKTRIKTSTPVKGEWKKGKMPEVSVLREQYESLGLSAVAREYKVSRQTVLNWLIKNNIPRLGRTEESEKRRIAGLKNIWQ